MRDPPVPARYDIRRRIFVNVDRAVESPLLHSAMNALFVLDETFVPGGIGRSRTSSAGSEQFINRAGSTGTAWQAKPP